MKRELSSRQEHGKKGQTLEIYIYVSVTEIVYDTPFYQGISLLVWRLISIASVEQEIFSRS